jgi:hypothetical protein
MKWTYSMFVGALLVALLSVAVAAEADAARQRYMQERENCLAGRSHQPQDVCLREASAALDAARRGQLAAEDPARLATNALARCDARPADQRSMCERMVRGDGTVTGSVDSGGFVREIRVIVEDPAAGK